MKTIILAGGSGTRLWPLSRKLYPKQFIQMAEFDNISFYQKTLQRALLFTKVQDIFIITNSDYKFHALNQAKELGIALEEDQILVEPASKNTLGAIAFGMQHFDENDVVVVLSADHIMKDEESFAKTIEKLETDAQTKLVLFGISPNAPHTGYGYIAFEKIGNTPYRVTQFKDKPSLEVAKEYVQNGYLWNAGIFMFSKKVFLSELQKWNPDYFALYNNFVKDISLFDKFPDVSIDYGLLEKSNNIFIEPLSLYWNDLGSFDAFDDYFGSEHIKNKNVIEIAGKENFVVCDKKDKNISLVGIDNLIVVDTRDSLFISKKGESQKVKDLVQELKIKNLNITQYGETVYRPWGNYTIIDEGVGYKTKRLAVLPGKKLSLQMHHHRSEHWVVVTGTAQVTVGEKEFLLQKGESTYIPVGTTHRLENPGKVELNIIESQIGDYLGEDDIVRFEDVYGRK